MGTQLASRLDRTLRSLVREHRMKSYVRGGRIPWSRGYAEYRVKFLDETLRDKSLMEVFRAGEKLPSGYGRSLDARVVEIPWALSRLGAGGGRLLDAGSSLNHKVLLKSAPLASRDVSILTLAPEAACHWKQRVSYHFGDVRETPFRDEYFDEIVCISTIEHVGLDNSIYTEGEVVESDSLGFLAGVAELHRVLRKGSRLLLTVPFGKYEHRGWFQQFDANLLDCLIEEFAPSARAETIFIYDSEGWQMGDRPRAEHCEFFDIREAPERARYGAKDGAAAERAVACVELTR